MKKINFGPWKKFGFEFLSIFIGVFAAFALDSWKDNQADQKIASRILIEINNGLAKDLNDVEENRQGHRLGLRAADYFKSINTNQQSAPQDSLGIYYFGLCRDFISVQNVSGYETLKSKGLEIIENDSLRSHIISLYEYDYNTIKKLEENYSELQFHDHFYKDFNDALAPAFNFNENATITGINLPLQITAPERNVLLAHLLQIAVNRQFILHQYATTAVKIKQLQKEIERELAQ